MKLLLINGPNMQLLGQREPDIYGTETLADIVDSVQELGRELGVEVVAFQSNHEGDIVDVIDNANTQNIDGIIINPAAYSHTSAAIRDAIAAVALPTVEVHMSNIYAREDFRGKSLISPVCVGTICGFGGEVYKLALRALARKLSKNK